MVKSDPWTMSPSDYVHFCEPVNTDLPELPPRSWAYHLSPTGIGTPESESLTSYFIRLAEAHLVTPKALFIHGMSKCINEAKSEISERAHGLVDFGQNRAASQINGSGLAAEKWVSRLKELTMRTELVFLTFLPWKDVLSNKMHRLERAWCPACFEDQRIANIPLHDQLRWDHKIVRACPTHKVYLETKCRHCQMGSTVLCSKSRPGICPRCDGWLGGHSSGINSTMKGHHVGDITFEIFVAEQIGELISKAVSLTCAPSREASITSIIKCADTFFDGNLKALVRFFGAPGNSTGSFYKRCPSRVSLELLLRIAFRAGVTLVGLLTNEHTLSDFNPCLTAMGANKRLTPRRKKENVYKILVAAINEKPPPSLNELARRLEYSSGSILRRYFPELCDQIRANHRDFTQGKKGGGFSTRRLQGNEVIKAALEAAMKEEPPPSVNQVSRSLGYATSESVRVRFPELCKALADRQRDLINTRRARIEGALKRAIESDPPVSLGEVSKGLGYNSAARVRQLFPEEWGLIRHRYEEHIRKQFLSKIETALRLILDETPPPSLKSALPRIGVSDKFLRTYFPKERRAIAERYLEFRHKQSMMNKEKASKKIKAIVIDLIKRGIFPSMTTVLKLFLANCLKRPEVWAIIRQAREEFSSSG